MKLLHLLAINNLIHLTHENHQIRFSFNFNDNRYGLCAI